MDNSYFPCLSFEGAEADISMVQSLRKWAESEVVDKRLELKEDYERLLKPAMQKLFVDMEMQKLLWSEEDGGAGHNRADVIFTHVRALEEIGRADTGIGFITAATFALCTTFALESTMNKQLCAKFAPLFCGGGEVITGALVLPLYGAESSSAALDYRGKYLQAAAKKEDGGWVIEGERVRPFNAGADAALVGALCYLEGEKEPGFIVFGADDAGVERNGAPLKTTGLAASRNAPLKFDRVRVPAENLVFRGDKGYRRMLSWLYTGIGAVTVGSLFAAFEIIKEWGNTRTIKGTGKIFKDNYLTAALMAEISHEILLSRLLIQRLAQMFTLEENDNKNKEEKLYITSLSTVAHVTAAAEKAINNIMELMGSAGYATEWNLERYWRDVKTMQVHLGNWELNKMELAQYFYESKILQPEGS